MARKKDKRLILTKCLLSVWRVRCPYTQFESNELIECS